MNPTQSGKAPSNGIEIYYETFGNPENPALVLIMGLGAQSILFGEHFIKPLVEAQNYVIRFDNRDIGLSTWMNDVWRKEKPYTLQDMADDTVGLLDFLKIEKAHILGVSLGAMIAQQLTLSYPDKVLSLISIMSSGYILNPKIAPFKQKMFFYTLPFLLKRFHIKHKMTEPEVSVRSFVIIYRRLVGTRFPYDEKHFRAVFTEAIESRKGQNPRGLYQQFCAIAASGSRLKLLHKIKVPTLIMHGTADPLIPPIHSKIYAPLIPHAKLVWLEGIGHELPKGILPQVHSEILGLIGENNPA
jgi:pimeloyl-ACP methyl ester carboxylesterase